MRKTQCDKCHAYALYTMTETRKTICANCKEIERSEIVNNGGTLKRVSDLKIDGSLLSEFV